MSALDTTPDARPSSADRDGDLDHVTCRCSEDLSLCGIDMTGAPWVDDEDDGLICVVCADLSPVPCPKCGW